MFLLRLFLNLLAVFHSCSENDFLHAYLPGDIMIGGLIPIHQQTNRTEDRATITCKKFTSQTFLHSQVMIYAIEEINRRTPRLLPNLTLGYDIYDTCGDVSLAIRAALQLLKNQSDPQRCLIPAYINSSLPEPETKAVIGERYSEVSIAVARILALPSVTQISYASTSELLSMKYKFPTFLRTVSSDKYQTQANLELVKNFTWQSVVIVGSDDEYGKYGSDSLEKHFEENNICVDFVEILPGNFNENSSTAKDLIEKITTSTAEAIIMFTKDANVRIILEAVIKQNITRNWIASDTWSTSPKISEIKGIKLIGPVFGFIFSQNEVPGFQNYVRSLFNGTSNAILRHYLFSINNSKEDMECNCQENTSKPNCLHCYIDHGESYGIYLAVQVIAEGLRSLLKCDHQSCERTRFTPFELFKEISNIKITVNNTTINFDANGDPSLGYDIMLWNTSESKGGVDIRKVGEYWPNKNISFSEDLPQWRNYGNVSVFNCSKKCQPGQILKSKKLGGCCHECSDCSSEEYSFGNGKPTAHSCVGIPLFGITFSLCISCILANLIQIMVGFSFDPKICSRIKKLNHPVAVVVIISGVQR
ncbi:G-protein coupled receptor family C group 6 member A-like [Cyprinodon tularosa]|uniref:G-protein coupled receptor family C group 6 member A-like n=1 Tax=Cyprinodon tularosa TaxID=77115 RepID=UPI0018E20D61|nr:G-protein coupled receptor family C group 6 member A-like [Cyprinodon tularosa]